MAKPIAAILGLLSVVFGLLGFLNTPVDGMRGFFAVDWVHTSVNIILGALLIGATFHSRLAVGSWLKIIGGILFLLGFIGILSVPSTGGILLGVAYTNGASNWLGILSGTIIFIVGVFLKDKTHMKGKFSNMTPADSP